MNNKTIVKICIKGTLYLETVNATLEKYCPTSTLVIMAR